MTANFKAALRNSAGFRREVTGSTGLEGSVPHQSVLDRIAEETITGKWNVKRANRCPKCFTYRSANGECMC